MPPGHLAGVLTREAEAAARGQKQKLVSLRKPDVRATLNIPATYLAFDRLPAFASGYVKYKAALR